MPTGDISRWSTDFRKRYAGVRMQQGRVVTDDDVNEAARLELEDTRETRIDIIGPVGSPDDGFAIGSASVTPNGPDFSIQNGTLYLGGLRLHLDDPTTYLGQSDFLEIDLIPAPVDGRVDLVYIEAWQQHVSAVEDEELFEKALAGPDTSTRLKTMQRIHVAPGVAASDCAGALTAVIAGLGGGTLNSELEWKPDSQLTVTFDPNSNPADLCNPPVQGGYLGAENQAIRVELRDNNQFTWGFDNASPMYRVEVQNDPVTGQPTQIHMLTAPKDQAHWPLAGQTIELLPWGALLPNGEIVADPFSGWLARVSASYGPDDQDFTIDTAVPAGFGTAWQKHDDAAQLAAGSQYFYMRVWNRGGDLSSTAAIGFVPNGATVPLGDTGLLVQFLGTQFRRGDYWVIAARPQTRDVVVPWQLMDKREPHGYQRFIASLGLIQWSQDPTTLAFTGTPIDDCRPTFPPLTRIRGCCTYTVGDGLTSFGVFSTIQDAVDQLPGDGGEICVLPGTHTGRVRIAGKQNIRIHGCGDRSIVVPGNEPGGGPLFYIEDSQYIELDSLHLQSGDAIAIQSRETANAQILTADLKFVKLEIETAQVAFDLEADNTISICENEIVLSGSDFRNLAGVYGMAAITVQSYIVLIERNSITISPGAGRLQAMVGGIHIRGGSERVEIRRNHIAGGNGNGITLGSFTEVPAGGGTPVIIFPGEVLVFDNDGCPGIVVIPPVTGGQPPQIESEGFLYDILIHDNRIELMGVSGIAGAYYVDPNGLTQGKASVLGSTILRLEISNNIIERCMALEIGDFPAELQNKLGFGGIALQGAADVRIRENLIRNSGVLHTDPICGLFAATIIGVDVEENTISGNGSASTTGDGGFFGTRGGIVFPELRDVTQYVAFAKFVVFGRLTTLEFAARIHDNTVSTPQGAALFLAAAGMVSVVANHFTSHGFPRLANSLQTVATGPAKLSGATTSFDTSVYTEHLKYLADTATTSRYLDTFGSAVVVIFDLSSLNLNSNAASTSKLNYTISTALFDSGVRGAAVSPASTGQILFNDNQVLADVTGNNVAPRSCILCYGEDDVSIAGNQSIYRGDSAYLTNALVFGLTLRFHGNRLQEPQTATTFSGLITGTWNITSHNQSTHCLIVLPIQLTVDTPNQPPVCGDQTDRITGLIKGLLDQEQ